MHYTDDLFGNKEYTFDVLSYGPLTYLKEEKKDNQKNNTSTKIYDGGRGEKIATFTRNDFELPTDMSVDLF